MHAHKRGGEPARTARTRAPALPTDLDAFREQLARTESFSRALREGRCRRTSHFDERLSETVDVLRPLFAPWNAEILFTLLMRGPQRFNALKRALAGVSARVLTDKLRALETLGLVDRSDAGYALAPRGEAVATLLHPVVFYLHNTGPLAGNHARSADA